MNKKQTQGGLAGAGFFFGKVYCCCNPPGRGQQVFAHRLLRKQREKRLPPLCQVARKRFFFFPFLIPYPKSARPIITIRGSRMGRQPANFEKYLLTALRWRDLFTAPGPGRSSLCGYIYNGNNSGPSEFFSTKPPCASLSALWEPRIIGGVPPCCCQLFQRKTLSPHRGFSVRIMLFLVAGWKVFFFIHLFLLLLIFFLSLCNREEEQRCTHYKCKLWKRARIIGPLVKPSPASLTARRILRIHTYFLFIHKISSNIKFPHK